jgi:hypothetical protein
MITTQTQFDKVIKYYKDGFNINSIAKIITICDERRIEFMYNLIKDNIDINRAADIIYLDDDIAYPKKMVETYEKMIAPNDNNVWTSTGFDFMNMHLEGKRAHKDVATIAEGYGSVCVKLNTFGDDFMEYMTRYTAVDNQICRLSDDVILSNYYHRRNVGINIMNIPGFLSINDIWQEQKILDYGNEADALHLGAGGTSDNNVDRYKRVIAALNKSKERRFKMSFITTETDATTGVIRNTMTYR